jgi:protocatechuate 3,4-dioxygenase beta subunit
MTSTLARAVLALALAAARTTHAQDGVAARLEGTVTDSVHARPMAGVHVVAVGTESLSAVRRATTSDSAGRYRIDSLAPGRYVVGFESPLLDSLEVSVSPREATVTTSGVTSLDLALPSAAKLRSAVCPGAVLPPGTGVILGHVVTAETESPLGGIEIAMAWRDLSVERKKRLRAISAERSASVVTDENGWYRVCGVPTGTWVVMQIQQNERTGPVLRTRVDDTLGIAVRHLSLAAAEPRSEHSAAGSDGGDARFGTARLHGTVVGPEGVPVAAAEVRVLGTRAATRTDTLGAFTLRGLPAGTQEVEVRRVGYAVTDVPVELRSETAATTTVLLKRIAVNLDSVVIVASRPKYPDFYTHQSVGWGRFLGPEQIAKERVARTSDIVAKIPGFQVVQRGYRAVVVSSQGAGIGECKATIVIDGVRVPYDNGPSLDDLHPSEIGAIEAYPASINRMAPAEYGIGGCGGIAIWTRR